MAAVTYGAHVTERTIPQSSTGKSVWKRLFEAVAEARLRQAEREIRMHRHLLPADFEIAGYKINERMEDSLPFVR